jgi:hypothetical protein
LYCTLIQEKVLFMHIPNTTYLGASNQILTAHKYWLVLNNKWFDSLCTRSSSFSSIVSFLDDLCNLLTLSTCFLYYIFNLVFFIINKSKTSKSNEKKGLLQYIWQFFFIRNSKDRTRTRYIRNKRKNKIVFMWGIGSMPK